MTGPLPQSPLQSPLQSQPPLQPRGQHCQTLTIIGPGRVGKTLGRLIVAAGAATLLDVLARTPHAAIAAIEFMGAGDAAADTVALRSADMYLLAVPDDQIEACCHRLVAAGSLAPGAIVFHASGAHTSTLLAEARQAGAAVASVHPVRSFADPAAVAAGFAGTCCGVEGDAAALPVLYRVFEAIGARMVPIDAAHKTLYHAGAVFASNYLVTLIDVAMQAYAKAGIERGIALQLIAPLLRETAENVFRLGPEAALTGPIARGDMQTVARQQQALEAWQPATASLYVELAHATTALASRRAP